MTPAFGPKAILIVFIVTFATAIATSPSTNTYKKCELDTDCPPGQLCRLICNRTCMLRCMFSNKIEHVLRIVTTSEPPFFDDGSNPLVAIRRDSGITPVTISEAELDAELVQSGDELPPINQVSITNVSVTMFTVTAPTPLEGTIQTHIPSVTDPRTIFPQLAKPQSSGLEDGDHESGYTRQRTTKSTLKSTFSTDGITVVTKLNTEAPVRSDITEEYQKTSVDKSSTPEVTTQLTTTSTIEPFSETDFFASVDLSLNLTTSETSSEIETNIKTLTTVTPSEATIANNVNPDSFSKSGEDLIAEIFSTQPTTIIPGIPPADPLDGCPAPEVCGKNCGIYIDKNGCQSCQCLWLPILCEEHTDCIEEGQFCDLGRCECIPGFIQDMLQSGICKRVTGDDLQSVKSASPVTADKKKENPAPSHYRRVRRQQPLKSSRADRFQWPGPCDHDSQCPLGLFCIQGDCWHLLDKPIKNAPFFQYIAPKGFPVGPYENSELTQTQPTNTMEAFTVMPLPESTLFNFAMFPHPRDGNGPPALQPTEEQMKSITSSTINPNKVVELPEVFQEEDDIIEGPLISSTRQSQLRRVFEAVTDASIPKLEEIIFKTKIPKTTTILPTVQSLALQPPKHRKPVVADEGWQEMNGPHHHHPFHRPSNPPRQFRQFDPNDASVLMTPTDHEMEKVILDYSKENRELMPVRVEMSKAREVIRDECAHDRQCGNFFKCCEKRWCDLSRECGTAKFCLPNCRTTKMTYLSSSGLKGSPLIDLIYD